MSASSDLTQKKSNRACHRSRTAIQDRLQRARIHLEAAATLFAEASLFSRDNATAQSLGRLARAAALACAPIASIRRRVRG